jgi:hypothetical protein
MKLDIPTYKRKGRTVVVRKREMSVLEISVEEYACEIKRIKQKLKLENDPDMVDILESRLKIANEELKEARFKLDKSKRAYNRFMGNKTNKSRNMVNRCEKTLNTFIEGIPDGKCTGINK